MSPEALGQANFVPRYYICSNVMVLMTIAFERRRGLHVFVIIKLYSDDVQDKVSFGNNHYLAMGQDGMLHRAQFKGSSPCTA